MVFNRTVSKSLPHLAVVLSIVFTAMVHSDGAAQEAPPPEDAPNLEPVDELIPPGVSVPPPTVPDSQAPAPPVPSTGGDVWLAHGPGPSLNGQVESFNPNNEVSGAIHTVAAHPTNAGILYAGGANGGVWKTEDATEASPFWSPLTDFESSLSIGALEFDPLDMTYGTLVAGIGRYSSFSQIGGARAGLLKTTDGGDSWTSIDGGGSLSGVGISGVAPRGNTIVVSSNIADSFTCGNVGIWRSVNGGASFSKLTIASGVPEGATYDLASDPQNSNILYTGMIFAAGCSGASNGIYKSTDTGASWSKISNIAMDGFIDDTTTNNIEIAANGNDVFVNIVQNGQTAGIFHSSDGGSNWSAMDLPTVPMGTPQVITFVTPGTPVTINTGSSHNLVDGDPVAISGVTGTTGANGVFNIDALSSTSFRLRGSSDATAWTGGGTWEAVAGLNPRNKPGGQGGIHASILVDPINSSRVYLGGDRQDFPFPNFVGALDFTGNLMRGSSSVPATGTSPSPQWDHLTHSNAVGSVPGGGTASSSAPHADSREMVFDANGDLIEVNDGGIARRTSPADNTGDWFSINGNIQVTEQHDLAYDTVSNIIMSGNQDTGTTEQSATNSLTWNSTSTADGGDVAVDAISTPGRSFRYSSFQNLGAFRRREYDANNNLISESFPSLAGATPFTVQFITPVVVNEVDGSRIVVAGAFNIVESFDKGETASVISSAVSFPRDAIAYGGKLGVVDNPDVLYIGTQQDVLVRTTTGAPLTDASAYPGTLTIENIVLDPDDYQIAYVADSTSIYMTTDAGATWTNITGNMVDPSLKALAFIPGMPDRLAAGGRDGVYELDLPPAFIPVWKELGAGLPNAPVYDMDYDATDHVLVVGTLGRGAWSLQFEGACGLPDNLLLRNEYVNASRTDKACTSITAGPKMQVKGVGTQLELVAGNKVTLASGFTVKTGAALTVEINPLVMP